MTSERIEPQTDSREMLYDAWCVIANVSHGNWQLQTAEWREAATRWRDRWHEMIDAETADE